MELGVGVDLDDDLVEELVDATIVPVGALPRATYPNKPDDTLPQFSYG